MVWRRFEIFGNDDAQETAAARSGEAEAPSKHFKIIWASVNERPSFQCQDIKERKES